MNAPIANQLSIDTKTLADHLRRLQPGEAASYEALTTVVHRDVQGEARHSLGSARRVLLREGIRFDVVRGEGLRRMTDSEIARSGSRGVRLVHLAAKREARKVAAVQAFDSLSEEEKVQHNAALSALQAVAHFSKPTQVRALEQAVQMARSVLPPADAIETVRRALEPKK